VKVYRMYVNEFEVNYMNASVNKASPGLNESI
jgi:hypothetical protein